MTKELRDLLIEHEGLRLRPYYCTAGKLTIGVGRNLDDNGITRDEAMVMLENDVAWTTKELGRKYSWFHRLDSVRQDVVVNMAFNLGIYKFSRFKQTIAYLEKGDYINAATEMLHSDWAEQVGKRARDLSKMMVTGEYPPQA